MNLSKSLSSLVIVLVSALLLLSSGCTSDTSSDLAVDGPASPPIDGTAFLLRDEPSDVADVIQVREQAADGDDVAMVGRIGGSENPWIDGLAAFSIVDRSLKACNDIEGDRCPIPWDYCCETPESIAANTAPVQGRRQSVSCRIPRT